MLHNKYHHHAALKTSSKPIIGQLSHWPENCTNSPCNWHKSIEMLLIKSGTGYIKYGAEELSLMPGDIVIINSNTLHHICSITEFVFNYIIIDNKFSKDNGIDVEKLDFVKKTRDSGTAEIYLNIVEELENEEKNHTTLSLLKLRRAALSMLIDLCSKHINVEYETTPNKKSSQEYVKKAMLYLDENYTQPISLDILSNLLGISKPHLAREFKKYTGQTIITYTNFLRCQKAAVCMMSGMNTTEAAMESGFESLSYFSRTYKKLYGIPPSKAKK